MVIREQQVSVESPAAVVAGLSCNIVSNQVQGVYHTAISTIIDGSSPFNTTTAYVVLPAIAVPAAPTAPSITVGRVTEIAVASRCGIWGHLLGLWGVLGFVHGKCAHNAYIHFQIRLLFFFAFTLWGGAGVAMNERREEEVW